MKHTLIPLLIIYTIITTACGSTVQTSTVQPTQTTEPAQVQQSTPAATTSQPTATLQPNPTATTINKLEVYMAKDNQFTIEFPDTWGIEEFPEFIIASHPNELAKIYILFSVTKIEQNVNPETRKEILNLLWAVGVLGIPEFSNMEVERHKVTTHFILYNVEQQDQVLYHGQMIEKWTTEMRFSTMIVTLLAPDSSPVLSTTVKQSVDSFSFSNPNATPQLSPNLTSTSTETNTLSTYTQPDGLFEINLPSNWLYEIGPDHLFLIVTHPTNTAHILVLTGEALDLSTGEILYLSTTGEESLIGRIYTILSGTLLGIGILGVPEITKTDIQNNQITIDFNLQLETTQVGQFETIYQGQLTMQWLTEQDPNVMVITLARPNSPLLELLEQSTKSFILNSGVQSSP